ncbi:vesicle-associated protein 2-1-like isoform X2 [Apium graveolens]|uniref:vesicle-associated protein 2-1-like isoform X2 n=1 Tax=Apium graveolens TaxID=4045 RepID=UPI003D7A0B6C
MTANLTHHKCVQSSQFFSPVELEKQVFCDLKVANTTDQHVAFKVKTTSPKKYFVRPNTGVIQPWDSCMIRVTLQAQKEYPPDMQSKDKFLLQSTNVSQQTDIDELPPDTFSKESGKVVEDCKLRVVYVFPQPGSTHGEDGLKQSSDSSNMHGSATNDDNRALQRLRDERDAAVRQTQQLQRDVERIKKQRSRKNEMVFSFKFSLYVALFGILAGFLLNVWLSSPKITPKNASWSSPPTPTPPTDTSLSSPPTPAPPTDAPPTPTPPIDASLSSPPTPTPPTDASLSSPPTPTPPSDESDKSLSTPTDEANESSSSPPTQTPLTGESDDSSSSLPTITTPTDASSMPPATTSPTDSEPSTPPME